MDQYQQAPAAGHSQAFLRRAYDLSTPTVARQIYPIDAPKIYGEPLGNYQNEVFEIRDRLVEMGVAGIAELNPPTPITWNDVSAYSENDLLDFESHGVTHEALSVMNAKELEAELESSQRRIEEATGKPCRHFCYPFGGKAEHRFGRAEIAFRNTTIQP